MTTVLPPPADSTADLETVRAGVGGSSPPTTPNDLLRVSRTELRRLASRLVTAGDDRPPSDPVVLVNEVARRLLGSSGMQDLPSRGDYYADLALAMRRLLRPGDAGSLARTARLWLSQLDASMTPTAEQLDAAIRKLEAQSPRHAQIATLRLLGGLTDVEIAEQMSLSPRRVAKGWLDAQAWLRRKLTTC